MRILFLILTIFLCHVAVADSSGTQASALEAQGDIPYKKDAGAGEVSYFKVMFVMFFLLSLAGGSLFLVKKSALANKLGIAEARFIRLIELKRLSPKLSVYLIAVHDRHYVLAQSGDNLSIVEHAVPSGFNGNE